MDYTLTLNDKQLQIQSVNQQFIQSLYILQCNAIQLNDFLEEQVLDNPVLEMEPVEFDQELVATVRNSDYSSLPHAASYSLSDYLLFQLDFLPLDNMERKICETLIDYIDDDGYLSSEYTYLASEYEKNSLDGAIDILQSLDPPGVCSRSLSECLALQLKASGNFDSTREEILNTRLENIAYNQLDEIARDFNLNIEEVQKFVEELKLLNPRPGSEFDNGSKPEYIIPDIYVSFEDHYANIRLNSSLQPSLSLNDYYVRLLQEAGENAETMTYIRQQLSRAKLLLDSIARRNRTILDVVSVVVDYQHDFFTGDDTALKVLTYSMVAKKLGIHTSTVGRAVLGKTIHTDRGTFDLKYFFPSGSNGGISDIAIKKVLCELVKNEDKHAPLSDLKLQEKLKGQGINISRRTVTKYRNALGIPDSYTRRLKD